MLLPALPQPRRVPHAGFSSGDPAVSGARVCCARMFTAAGAGREVVKTQKRSLFSFSAIYFSRIFQFLGFQHIPYSHVFLTLFFLDYMFPSYVYSLFCFIQM